MKRRVKDFRTLAVWNEARTLTLAAYQLTGATHDNNRSTLSEIQRTCITILSSIQHLGETGSTGSSSYAVVENATKRLGQSLAQAHAQGLVGTYNLNLMLREVSAIEESLSELQHAS